MALSRLLPKLHKRTPNLSEYDFINEQPSQGLPQCHFPTGESLSGTFCPIPTCCTAVGLGPSFTAHLGFPSPFPSPFLSAPPSLLPSPSFPLHCRGAHLLAVVRQTEHETGFLKTSLVYFPVWASASVLAIENNLSRKLGGCGRVFQMHSDAYYLQNPAGSSNHGWSFPTGGVP